MYEIQKAPSRDGGRFLLFSILFLPQFQTEMGAAPGIISTNIIDYGKKLPFTIKELSYAMDQFTGLSNREREVVKLLLEGKSNKQIALALHITRHTVEFHLKNVYSKCHVNSRTELILKLGQSVVVGEGEKAENGYRLNFIELVYILRKAVSRIRKELKMENGVNATALNGEGSMTFYSSIRVCFKKYAEFQGRASLAEFWWFMLFVLLVASAFTYASETLGSIFLIAVLLPLLAAGARRLRDSGTSAWWQLFLLAPVGGIVVLGFLWARPTLMPQPDETLPA